MKAIVVEDLRLQREGLVIMLQEFPEIQVAGEAEDVQSALPLIEQIRPDVVFLDIHLSDKHDLGFNLLEKLSYQPRIIFTTAYSEYAVRAFDYNTVDYLLKPISRERLATSIKKLGTSEDATESVRTPFEMNAKYIVWAKEKPYLVPLASIKYFENDGNYARIYWEDKNGIEKKSLTYFEERLPKSSFFRANRRYIVNLHHIADIEAAVNDNFIVTMIDGTEIEISRRVTAELKKGLCGF